MWTVSYTHLEILYNSSMTRLIAYRKMEKQYNKFVAFNRNTSQMTEAIEDVYKRQVLCNAKVVIIFWVRDILVRTLLLINFLLNILMSFSGSQNSTSMC